MFTEINLEAVTVDERNQVVLRLDQFTGTDSWSVYIDNFYHGRIIRTNPLYHDINPKSWLTTEDIYILVDIIKTRA